VKAWPIPLPELPESITHTAVRAVTGFPMTLIKNMKHASKMPGISDLRFWGWPKY
jgi:hypothetical protein